MSEPDFVEELSAGNLSSFDAAPQVRAPDSPWVFPAGAIAVVALGALVFWQLSAARERAEARPEAVATAPGPQQQPEPSPPTQVEAQASPELPLTEPSSDPGLDAQSRLQAPALIVDLSEAHAAAPAQGEATESQNIASAISDALSGDERFAARFDSNGAARAHALAHPNTTIAQGSIIAAVLETAIDSDAPGYARALVTRDMRGFDGARVLIPRGSRLIGQYRSSPALGTSRVFVIWNRVIRPDGVSVDLNSPAADALGRSGLAGETDTHFLSRFGGAILLTLIGAAGQVAANGDNTQVVIGVSQGAQSAAAASMGQQGTIPPTVRVAQGAPIRVFVSRDLDFSAIDSGAP